MADIKNTSIFGIYKNAENRATSALLHIMNIGGPRLISYIFKDKIINFPQPEINISTQDGIKKSGSIKRGVADGMIKCDYTFNIQLECKLKGDISKEQLENYKKLLADKKRVLVYILKYKPKGDVLKDVPYFTWQELNELLKLYINEYDDIRDIEKFLIEQFVLLLENLKLVDYSENRVIVVGGAWGEDVAQKYHFYACQNHRYFKKARYIAFYRGNRINTMYKIIGEPMDDVNLKSQEYISHEYFTNTEPNYNEDDLRKVFKLESENLLKHEICNDTRSRTGKVCAFTQYQRYAKFESFNKAQVTSDLEID